MPTKVHLVKAVVFPVVMCECESWTIKQAECWRIDAFELWCWRRLLIVPWAGRRSNQSILNKIRPQYSLEGLMLKLKLQYFGHLMRRAESESANCSVVSNSLQPNRLYSPWNSPGQNTEMGSLFLLQGNLPNPEIEPTSPALQSDSLPQGTPQGIFWMVPINRNTQI